jgi:hypothetical protein
LFSDLFGFNGLGAGRRSRCCCVVVVANFGVALGLHSVAAVDEVVRAAGLVFGLLEVFILGSVVGCYFGFGGLVVLPSWLGRSPELLLGFNSTTHRRSLVFILGSVVGCYFGFGGSVVLRSWFGRFSGVGQL